jgi:hypothetical protein
MDDYKKVFYAMKPQLQGKDFGDISERLEIRKRLKCKSFEWYLKNVIPELVVPDLYPLGRGEVGRFWSCYLIYCYFFALSNFTCGKCWSNIVQRLAEPELLFHHHHY